MVDEKGKKPRCEALAICCNAVKENADRNEILGQHWRMTPAARLMYLVILRRLIIANSLQHFDGGHSCFRTAKPERRRESGTSHPLKK